MCKVRKIGSGVKLRLVPGESVDIGIKTIKKRITYEEGKYGQGYKLEGLHGIFLEEDFEREEYDMELEKEATDFADWIVNNFWDRVNETDWDNHEEPNSAIRLTTKELYLEFKKQTKN
ncbi:unnamed protein product [marine sediment metagenome]|uniref:Uncharacterized protein n=1 Tax=marine sediment metagenome TaxID=412755 RepID=X0UI72_9ZZZZ